jgi:hypothetical protein
MANSNQDSGQAESTIVYPSEAAPDYSSFALDFPPDWESEITPFFLALVLDPTEIGGFHANIGVGATRIQAETTLDMASAASLEEAVNSFQDFSVTRDEASLIGGQPAAMRLQSFYSEVIGLRVGQLQLLFFAPDRPGERPPKMRELFRIHATCSADAINTYAEIFVKAAMSFRFLDGSSTHASKRSV